MVVSGIVIASRPEDLSRTNEAVEVFSWAEVHYSEPTGRVVVTIEADSIEQSMDRFEQLQKIPSVLSASLAEYCMDELKQGGESKRTLEEMESS